MQSENTVDNKLVNYIKRIPKYTWDVYVNI